VSRADLRWLVGVLLLVVVVLWVAKVLSVAWGGSLGALLLVVLLLLFVLR